MAQTRLASPDSGSAQLSLSFGPGDAESVPLSAKSASSNAVSTPKTKSKSSAQAGDGSRRGATAETLATQQRDISVSEFFAKNRHLLGFDNKRKALLTTVKEAVDNSLDACEEAGILPEIHIIIKQVDQDRFRVTVRDNGPGIVKAQIPNVFGKLLYGSKFHRLKMSRGQQGIGISAAGMYGLITTGKPVHIISRTSQRVPAHDYALAIDTRKNRPDIIRDQTIDVEWAHGTQVTIELQAAYNKGRQSVDEYLELTAIANPHAQLIYLPPTGGEVVFPRGAQSLPRETKEIKPHPYGIELGTFIKMVKETQSKNLGGFLSEEFSRVSDTIAKRVCEAGGVTARTRPSAITPPKAERIYAALQEQKLRAPSTDCLAPMGAEVILTGLLKGIKAEFYTASTRPPSVYRGNPFQIEVGLAYGGGLGSDRRDEHHGDDEDDKSQTPVTARVIRFANRVPLLYQPGSCCTVKAVSETRWNGYGLSQPGGGLPQAPLVIFIHMASVWVPFISEGKEAIADYDEIRKEIRLGISECGRRLGMLLRRKRKKATYAKRRDVFTRYINEVVDAVRAITVVNTDEFRRSLVELSKLHTSQADMEFDDHGEVIKAKSSATGNDIGLPDTIVVDAEDIQPDPETLFETGDRKPKRKKQTAKPKKKRE